MDIFLKKLFGPGCGSPGGATCNGNVEMMMNALLLFSSVDG